MKKEEKIRNDVRRRYGKIAQNGSSCCSYSCCVPQKQNEEYSLNFGYNINELSQVPEGANLGLGCGSPLAFSEIKGGEIVVDLGSGAGLDSFIAATKVGKKGFVYGIDMTDEMISKSKENALKGGFKNVSFIKGTIENIPLDDEIADLIISNCVINLSPQKERVFKESFRILKRGGRMVVSDIVLKKNLPQFILDNKKFYSLCISGAVLKDEYLRMIENAGFSKMVILSEKFFPIDYCINEFSDKEISQWIANNKEEIENLNESLLSVTIKAVKIF